MRYINIKYNFLEFFKYFFWKYIFSEIFKYLINFVSFFCVHSFLSDFHGVGPWATLKMIYWAITFIIIRCCVLPMMNVFLLKGQRHYEKIHALSTNSINVTRPPLLLCPFEWPFPIKILVV